MCIKTPCLAYSRCSLFINMFMKVSRLSRRKRQENIKRFGLLESFAAAKWIFTVKGPLFFTIDTREVTAMLRPAQLGDIDQAVFILNLRIYAVLILFHKFF